MDTNYLETQWNQLTESLATPTAQPFEQLTRLYTQRGRYYHTLHHVEALLRLSEEYRDQLTDRIPVDYAIWYHDAIYRATRSDNEEQSAALAVKILTELGLSASVIEVVKAYILATKTHTLPETMDHFDAKFLLDIDLSILAATPAAYEIYTKQVRKEYLVYPGPLYRRGRKKVLQHFLAMPRIYHTDLLYERFEKAARANLQQELNNLKVNR